jgi:hypothetical protein
MELRQLHEFYKKDVISCSLAASLLEEVYGENLLQVSGAGVDNTIKHLAKELKVPIAFKGTGRKWVLEWMFNDATFSLLNEARCNWCNKLPECIVTAECFIRTGGRYGEGLSLCSDKCAKSYLTNHERESLCLQKSKQGIKAIKQYLRAPTKDNLNALQLHSKELKQAHNLLSS